MIDELKPEGILEEETVFKIIDTGFRLRRIGEVEAGVYNQEILHHEADEYKNKIADKIEFKEEGRTYSIFRFISKSKGIGFCKRL
jgi:hypothetical protein